MKMKTCEHIEPELSAYIFDELDPLTRKEVETHLAACENCRKELEDLRATLGALEERFGATPVAAELSAGRVEAIREGASGGTRRGARIIAFSPTRHPVIWGLGMAAALLLVVSQVAFEMLKPGPGIQMAYDMEAADHRGMIENDMAANRVSKDQSERKLAAARGSNESAGEYTINAVQPAQDTSKGYPGSEIAEPDLSNAQLEDGSSSVLHADPEKFKLGRDEVAPTAEPAKEAGTEIAMAETRENKPSAGGLDSGSETDDSRVADGLEDIGYMSGGRAGTDKDAGNKKAEAKGPAPAAGQVPEAPKPAREIASAAPAPLRPNNPKDGSLGAAPAGAEIAAEERDPFVVHTMSHQIVDTSEFGFSGTTEAAPSAKSPTSAAKSRSAILAPEAAALQRAPMPQDMALEAPPNDMFISNSAGAAMPAPADSSAMGVREFYDSRSFRRVRSSFEVADAPEEQIQRIMPNPQPAPQPGYYYNQPPQDMTFQDYGVNPFVQTQSDPLSTFSMDVDTGSFTVARNYLNRNTAPPPAAIRVEEIINFLPAPYPAPKRADFAVYGEMAPSPFGQNLHLLKIGIKGREMGEERKPVVLTFVIDVSGSMDQENRLGLVQRTLNYLTGFMHPGDQIGIAVFSSNGRELLAHTDVRDRSTIMNAVNSLRPEQSTNVGEGLLIGYGMARRAYNAKAVNRVVLCSDGVANTGVTNVGGILDLAAQGANEKIYLTSLGVGMGNFNDTLMEQLADKGNGHYAYLDTDQEAERYVSRELVGAMEVIAQDTKIQVEFNPAAVQQYRLLGFENRNVADADFRNDKVDAGEIGTGHAVTALYEVELAQGAEADLAATVRVRYKRPDAEMTPKEITGKLKLRDVMKTFEASEPHFKLVAIAAEYAEILRNSYWSRGSDMRQVAALFDRCFPGNPPSAEAGELRGLIDIATRVAWNRPAPVPPVGVIPNEPKPEPFPGAPGNEVPMEEEGAASDAPAPNNN